MTPLQLCKIFVRLTGYSFLVSAFVEAIAIPQAVIHWKAAPDIDFYSEGLFLAVARFAVFMIFGAYLVGRTDKVIRLLQDADQKP
jgi:hypothetical protein